MTISEMWHNGSKRLLVILIVISVVILLIVGGVAAGVFYLSFGLQKVNSKVGLVSDRQNEIVVQVKENVDSISTLSKSVNEGWQTFQKANPTQPIPQIADIQAVPEGKTEVVLKPALAKPKPTSTPKVRTVIKYKARPKPTPFRLFGPSKKKS